LTTRIAIVGLACRYPDATSPFQLWENVLAGRRAFRRLPDERMNLADYWSADPSAPDRFYSQQAAVIEGYEFDRVAYRVAGSTYRSTDLTHWLALDIAAQALADAGFPDGAGLPRSSTGVIVGNSLTGEFSRASLMRLRWPYVRRVVAAALREQGFDDERLVPFLAGLERQYKSPFPAIDEDSLAGGLANTIAGRICNHFDLKGGGYTVDGACSSSLLSVATACRALGNGELDVAVAGGVDLSIDPFEVIGFAKTGALATGEMRVYDKHSNGFWPGEGCGMAVLMREPDARASGRTVYALIAGWGVSSDGKGGITRPEASGHQLAIERAYARAGFGPETVGYFEGHGTGTAVGDATELRALSMARRLADPDAPPAAVGTVKGNIGHTKAAAGIAGVIKATLAVWHGLVPPATGHLDPHPELLGERPALRVPLDVEAWPEGAPVRAGVSSMGFGGINTHLVLEAAGEPQRAVEPARALVASRQDAELLLLDADSPADLRERVARLAEFAGRLSYAELADLAAQLYTELADRPIRAAVLCARPEEAQRRLTRLLDQLDSGARAVTDLAEGIFLGHTGLRPRIGYLFPGQGSGRGGDGGALRRRFATADALYLAAALPVPKDHIATAVAQPRIVTASVAGLRVLSALGIDADVAVGHSLGELTALHWAGAFDEDTLLRMAAARGAVMAEASHGGGAMASIGAPAEVVERLLPGEPVVIAGYNSPRQTVVSGPADAVTRVGEAAGRQGLPVTRLPVSHAFHSPLVQPAAIGLAQFLAGQRFRRLDRRVMSTVTGGLLPDDTDVRALLRAQVLEPVRFAEATARAAHGTDLLIEVGPGQVLSGLAAEVAPGVAAVSLDCGGPSLAGLLRAVGAAYTLGVPVRFDALFAGRLTRPLPDGELKFFASPCERAPELSLEQAPPTGAAGPGGPDAPAADDDNSAEDTLNLLLRLAAQRAELPPDAVSPDSLPLDELHLSSITVGQIMNDAARALGLAPPAVGTSFATSTLRELAGALDDLRGTGSGGDGPEATSAAGVADWVRAFAVEWAEAPVPSTVEGPAGAGEWSVFAADGHPWAEPVSEALRRTGLGGGVLLCLRRDCDETDVPLMLAAAHAALAGDGPTRFVAVQQGRGATGLAKTLHLEAPRVATCVLDVPVAAAPRADLVRAVLAEVAGTAGFTEVRYDDGGTRRVPALRPLPRPARPAGPVPLDATDVLLVTGGGKGITAECALALARDTGVRLGLLGRSDPAGDPELAANLDRLSAAGVSYRYLRADVTAVEEVRAAVAALRDDFGPVTAVLHGAGRNEPRALAHLDEDAFGRTLAPKLDGLRAVLAAVDPDQLRLLVTFGSIIGRAGLRGEADYATANDWLSQLTEEVARRQPRCRCLAMEWSVWSGAGMGERLGVLESLVRGGITPIPTDRGIDALRELLADPEAAGLVVITGRAQGVPTLRLAARELPLLRFVDQPRVYYPGVELVADAELSSASDPYLDDHLLDGSMLFPAVIGMEAMAQVAAALTGHTGAPVLEDVEFLRPVVVQPGSATTIRVAGLAVDDDTVRAVIRSAETGFQADHFRATLRYRRPGPEGAPAPEASRPPVPVDPLRELYGGILFQGKRFQRLVRYRAVAARSCQAEISLAQPASWFGTFLPQDTLLGDPGARDAFMHSIQSCVPNATLLPVGVRRLYPLAPAAGEGLVTMHAVERAHEGDTYTYDVDVYDAAGALVERWEGLRLQAVRKQDGRGPWVPVLLGPYLERRLTEGTGTAPVAVVVEPEDRAQTLERRPVRRDRTALALRRALGGPATVRYRADGKPEVDGAAVSASHGAGVTLAVAGDDPLGCDIQAVPAPSDVDWPGLLGPLVELARQTAGETGEAFHRAATRVWTVVECVRKAGQAVVGQATLDRHTPDGWVSFAVGEARVATFVTTLANVDGDVVVAVLAGQRG
jgi:enediyne polyketide synthase